MKHRHLSNLSILAFQVNDSPKSTTPKESVGIIYILKIDSPKKEQKSIKLLDKSAFGENGRTAIFPK